MSVYSIRILLYVVFDPFLRLRRWDSRAHVALGTGMI